jgi:VNT family MFS transporter (synaptic vesicle glycoprotein 2)
MMAEYVPGDSRGTFITLIAWFWMVGSLMAAGLAWFILGTMDGSWQLFAALCSIPAFVTAAFAYLLLPETPRFLLVSGQNRNALAVLEHIGAVNGIREPARLEKTFTEMGTVGEGRDSRQSCGILFGASLLPTTLVLQITWFCLSFGSYGLSVWIPTLLNNTDSGGEERADDFEFQVAFIYNAASLVGNILALVLVERAPRKWLMCGE